MDSEVPVVIAGGGLVGLSLALFLADTGVDVLVAEQRLSPSALPRGRGLNLRTMEVLRSAGIEAALRAAPPSILRDLTEIAGARTLAGEAFFHAIRPAAESYAALSPVVPLVTDQNEVEPVLRAEAVRRGARVHFGTRVDAFEQDAEGVTVQLTGTAVGDRQQVRASYLVAADGHRSAVRAALGIATSGPGSLAHYVNIPFEADLSEALRGRRLALCYLDEPVPHTMLTRLDSPTRWVLMVPYRPEAGERAEDFTPGRSRELIRAAAGLPGLALRLPEDEGPGARTWELAAWTAVRYRAGRVLLAGDAAHVMAPAGGLGGNTGVQDAHNLAWKLAAVVRGRAGEELLDSYEHERRPVALAVGEQSVRRQLARRSARGSTPPPRPAAHPLAAVLGHRYRSSAVLSKSANDQLPEPLVEFTGEPGSRAPHLVLRAKARSLSSLDLYSTRFVLLCAPAARLWEEAGRRVAAEWDLAVYRLGAALHDPSGTWASAHGVTERGAVLVRPDGYVCWRAADAPADGAAATGGAPHGRTGSGTAVLDAVLSTVLGTAGAPAAGTPGPAAASPRVQGPALAEEPRPAGAPAAPAAPTTT
ncbi:FAD-dependent monooxygenase [Streptomyces tremellae]|uniref:FAD-dependent oxidoreductase n=1 Tax=Streptomyces tremellae TaxID=1124239 RepID=A0ABP7EXN4_9ACTN